MTYYLKYFKWFILPYILPPKYFHKCINNFTVSSILRAGDNAQVVLKCTYCNKVKLIGGQI